MTKYFIATLIILIFESYSNKLFAQEKFEMESRLKQNDVPSNALNFIDSLSLKNKVKWYLEEGIERKSIEAKFKRSGKKHSVEFDILGNIEDVEIEVNNPRGKPTGHYCILQNKPNVRVTTKLVVAPMYIGA